MDRTDIELVIKARDNPSFYIEHFLGQILSKENEVLLSELHSSSLFENNNSKLTLCYILWYVTFHYDRTILIGANKFDQCKLLIGELNMLTNILPSYMRLDIKEFNKHGIRFSNGCQVISEAIGYTFGKGRTVNILYLYDFDNIQQQRKDSYYQWWKSSSYLPNRR